jgi:hypothetical protein
MLEGMIAKRMHRKVRNKNASTNSQHTLVMLIMEQIEAESAERKRQQRKTKVRDEKQN